MTAANWKFWTAAEDARVLEAIGPEITAERIREATPSLLALLPTRDAYAIRLRAYKLRRQRAEAGRAPAEEHQTASRTWAAAGAKLFADDPRAIAEAGQAARIVPQDSHAASPIGSSASWAVRG